MYPMTITLHDHNQLNAVMAALGFVQPIEAPKADTKPAKNKKEPAQATVAIARGRRSARVNAGILLAGCRRRSRPRTGSRLSLGVRCGERYANDRHRSR